MPYNNSKSQAKAAYLRLCGVKSSSCTSQIVYGSGYNTATNSSTNNSSSSQSHYESWCWEENGVSLRPMC